MVQWFGGSATSPKKPQDGHVTAVLGSHVSDMSQALKAAQEKEVSPGWEMS